MKRLALIVTGDRHATDRPDVEAMWSRVMDEVFARFHAELDSVVVVHGACGWESKRRQIKGIDAIADRLGRHYGFAVIPVPANWELHGKAAGPIRNQGMADLLQQFRMQGFPIRVLAFHDDLAKSKGTKDMIDKAKWHGIPFRIYGSDGSERGRMTRMNQQEFDWITTLVVE